MSHKPHIRKHGELWLCKGFGRHSWGATPMLAWVLWTKDMYIYSEWQNGLRR